MSKSYGSVRRKRRNSSWEEGHQGHGCKLYWERRKTFDDALVATVGTHTLNVTRSICNLITTKRKGQNIQESPRKPQSSPERIIQTFEYIDLNKGKPIKVHIVIHWNSYLSFWGQSNWTPLRMGNIQSQLWSANDLLAHHSLFLLYATKSIQQSSTDDSSGVMGRQLTVSRANSG